MVRAIWANYGVRSYHTPARADFTISHEDLPHKLRYLSYGTNLIDWFEVWLPSFHAGIVGV